MPTTPTAPGKPELNEGFVQVACELFPAILAADFSKAELVVLSVVMAQLYGPDKLEHAVVVSSNVAARGGWKRQFIERGRRDLIRANVLVPIGGDIFRINKYYRTWVTAGRVCEPDAPRFTETELAFIASSRRYVESDRDSTDTSGRKKSNQRVAKSATNGLHDATNGLHSGNQRVASVQPTGCIPATNGLHAHIDEARALPEDLELESINSEAEEKSGGGLKSSTPKTDATATRIEADPDPILAALDARAFPAPKPSPPKILNRPPAVGAVDNDPARVKAVVEFARKTWDDDAAESVEEAAEDYHVEDIDAALRKAKLKGAGWQYASTVLCQWWSETGGRKKHRPGGETPKAAASRPVVYHRAPVEPDIPPLPPRFAHLTRAVPR